MEHLQTQKAQAFFDTLKEIAQETPGRASLIIAHKGEKSLQIAAKQPMRVCSMSKMVVGLAFARKAAKDPAFAGKKVLLSAVNDLPTKHFDGPNHAAWQETLKGAPEATMEQIAEGMLKYSSNRCTNYFLNTLGQEHINAIIQEYGLSMQQFGTELTNLQGSTLDMVNLSQKIQKEPRSVSEMMRKIAPVELRSSENISAFGFAKGGSDYRITAGKKFEDICFMWHAKNTNGCFIVNDVLPETKKLLETNMIEFMCESVHNRGFLNKCRSALSWQEFIRAGCNALRHL